MELHTGALLFLWILALLASIFMPGFSYLLTWPVLFSGLAACWVVRKAPEPDRDGKLAVILTAGALPGLIVLAPAIYVMYHFALAPMIGIMAFMPVVLLGLLIPQLDLLMRSRRWLLPVVSLGICLVFLMIGSMTAHFTPERPRPNAVAYLLDADSGEAVWFSGGTQRDPWTDQFHRNDPDAGTVGELFPVGKRSRFPVLRTDAPAVDLPPPNARIVSDRLEESVRTLQLDLGSPRGAEVLMIDIKPYRAVRAVTIGKKRMEAPVSARELWELTYYAVPAGGFGIVLEVDPSEPVELQVTDQSWDLLPEVLDTLEEGYRLCSKDMMRMPNFDYGTLVVRSLRFEAR
jgi:hypothetical protein